MDLSNQLQDKKSPILKYVKDPLRKKPTIDEAIELSKKYSIGMHPHYTYYWNELQASQLITFLEYLEKHFKILYDEDKKELTAKIGSKEKRIFELLGVNHKVVQENIENIHSEDEAQILVFEPLVTKTFLTNLGIYNFNNPSQEELKTQIRKICSHANENLTLSSCEIISKCCEIEIRDKGGTYIGARMGRPEKAKPRKIDGSPHGLFPIGDGKRTKTKSFGHEEEREELLQNRLKNILEAQKQGTVEAQFAIYHCPTCNDETLYRRCHICNEVTNKKFFEKYTYRELPQEQEDSIVYKKTAIEIKPYVDHVRKVLKLSQMPKLVKGIKGTINKEHIVEHLTKAFLRQQNNIHVNKDGSIRYDMIEMGFTHFKPKEIETSIEKLKELGYTHDYKGEPLVSDEQILEMLPQDVALPDCPVSGEMKASDFVINTGNYVDQLLERLYGLEPFYNFKTRQDTVGHLVIGLAPHTSAGIVGRIIGYTKTQGCFSHPVWHAAQRRNLDGDENGIMLLLDGLINFSREFLPDRRGARTMDTSLVLTSHLYLDQIDDEVHGMDIVDHYPLELYQKAKEFASPKSIKLDTVEKRISVEDDDQRYLNYQFTHDTTDMNDTVLCSSYKSVPSMKDKLHLQLELGRKIRAVDEDKVGTFVIDKHFMKDIKGNLRKFGMQTFRCTNCNTKYRRPPLVGKCINCGLPSINFTISEGSVKKYIDPSFQIVKNFEVDPYVVEVLELTQLRLEGVFGKEVELQKSLSSFFK